MAITSIPLSRLKMELERILNECANSGETIVVEMPDQRLLAIRSLEPEKDDSLMDDLLAFNPKFQGLVAKSRTSGRKPFTLGQPE